MKRYPQCNHVETDDSLGYCRTDGAALTPYSANSEGETFVATIHAALGEKDKAFAELEEAYRQHDWRMSAQLKTDPLMESLRDDARYKDLLKRMNLPE